MLEYSYKRQKMKEKARSAFPFLDPLLPETEILRDSSGSSFFSALLREFCFMAWVLKWRLMPLFCCLPEITAAYGGVWI
ncbi:hypothetical protein ACG2K1_02760 [Neisseria sp. 23W00296]|uniref:hypothetical protein n=1 Tax=unclassified Neisseria TaxID=2623750 RepID=UPI0037573414